MKNIKSELHTSYIYIGCLGDHTYLDSWIQSWTLYLIMVSIFYDKILSYKVFLYGWQYLFKNQHWNINWTFCVNTYIILLYHKKVMVSREHNYPYKIQYITYILVISRVFQVAIFYLSFVTLLLEILRDMCGVIWESFSRYKFYREIFVLLFFINFSQIWQDFFFKRSYQKVKGW